jgi:hypothetical protein
MIEMQLPVWVPEKDGKIMGYLKEWVHEKNKHSRCGLITLALYQQIIAWRKDKGIEKDLLLLGDDLPGSEAIAKAFQRSKKVMMKS